MKTEICLLDLDYEEMDGDISIILYGRTTDRKRVVVVDPAYEPYFYVLPRNLNKAKREIEIILEKRNLKVKRIEETRRKLFGEEKEFLKIYCFLPQDTTKARDVIKDLVVYEQLNKPIGEYKVISPHISAAKKLIAKGIPVNAGSVVGFVIEKGSGSISEKAQPVEFADLKRIDMDCYIHHQVLPASLRILKVLGVDEEKLLKS